MVNFREFHVAFRNWLEEKGAWYYLEQVSNSFPRCNVPWPGCHMENMVKLVPGIHIDLLDDERTVVLDSFVTELTKNTSIQADLQ